VSSLGVVFYEAVSGLNRRRLPELSPTLSERPDLDSLLQVNRIILRTCQPEVERRYQSAAV